MERIRQFIILIISTIWISCQSMVKESNWQFSSPDHKISLNLRLVDGALQYDVRCDEVQILNTSDLGIIRKDADLSSGMTFIERSENITLLENMALFTGKQLKVAKGLGEAKPSGMLQTSWKTLAIGNLNTIVKSDLVKVVSPGNRIQDTTWIRPGRVSWSWLSDQ